MNKKGQAAGIIAFISVAIGLLIMAPFILKVANTTLGGFSSALNDTSQEASNRVDYIQDTFVGFWDWMIALAFFINIIMLFVFAFLVDSHPIFSLFYLISAVVTLMFANTFLAPVQAIFGETQLSDEVLQLPITGFIINSFDIILLAIIVLTGIIMYGKFKSGGGIQR